MAKKHYDTLGVSENASQDDIKKAFKKLAVTHHPDKGGDEKRFKDINEANNILSDPQKRRVYDMQGDATADGGVRHHRSSPHFHPFDHFGFMNVFFNQHHQQQSAATSKPKVYEKVVTISLE